MEIETGVEAEIKQSNYKDIFDDLIEDLTDIQLDDLAEEIKNQKLLLKVKSERRIKMKKEIKAERVKLQKEMKDSISKSAKKQVKEESDSEEEEIIKKKSKKNK